MAELTQNPMLIDPDMKEIVESFIVETKEILEKLDVDLVEMEKDRMTMNCLIAYSGIFIQLKEPQVFSVWISLQV